eukprot:CAMPEP_0202915604 /NCGR_PEP_ID=MMETSP1392-20130828/66133_1 /ASSEMBLY_ACC=CAM_ASM_000868 /TAXON_ID=225041 /ORGANISM="Chlamydomonas chlamydogama, Strain SAG 11-48b" /LENGTH=81 /DNA_ID=CAMNT_0049607709 /DNA_START=270 /DNA_END=515 /DNA_ORIENTATION=+
MAPEALGIMELGAILWPPPHLPCAPLMQPAQSLMQGVLDVKLLKCVWVTEPVSVICMVLSCCLCNLLGCFMESVNIDRQQF